MELLTPPITSIQEREKILGKKMVKLKNYLILSPNMRKVDYFVLETRC